VFDETCFPKFSEDYEPSIGDVQLTYFEDKDEGGSPETPANNTLLPSCQYLSPGVPTTVKKSHSTGCS
jgi:hypothetical protein